MNKEADEADIEELKILLCEAGRILTYKWLNESFGHVTARIPGEQRFLMTTRGALGFVEPSEIELVDFDGRKLTKNSREGAPNEVFLHAEVYKTRPEVMAIARTQSKWCEVFGIAGESVKPVHDFGAILMGEVKVFDQPVLGDVKQIGLDMVKQLQDMNAIILRGNGSVVLGRSVQEAVVRAVFLDESAFLQLHARLLPGQTKFFDEQEVRKLGEDLSRPDRIKRAWDNWLALATTPLSKVNRGNAKDTSSPSPS